MDEPFELPIDGVLDLHTFRPQDVKEVLIEYLAECRKRGLLEVRVIHGKGIGQLRQTVHTLLARLPEVASYAQASEAFGGWGATMVHLRPLAGNDLPWQPGVSR
jgi:DNA-nicking Smr family endonuclease